MQKPSLGWQSWSPPFKSWHGFPRWDYSPLKVRPLRSSFRKSPGKTIKIRYWCSWYAYGWNINHQKILDTLKIINNHQLPFTHIIIDDGWTTWGDWHTPNPNRFPNIAETIKNIQSHKLQAGLWFVPFLANKKSRLFENHPEWFIKYQGKYVQGLKTMPIWEWFLSQQYLLNFELPEVKKYLTDFLDLAINKWGITLLKLDFLYASYFNPNHQTDQVPHNQIVWLLQYIKTHYPEVSTIACGAPFAPTVGLANIIRISKDTALPPIFPDYFNRLVYSLRIKMLHHKLSNAGLPANIFLDPDIRRFSLDTKATTQFWDTISTKILGIGDDLSNLSLQKLKDVQQWLSK